MRCFWAGFTVKTGSVSARGTMVIRQSYILAKARISSKPLQVPGLAMASTYASKESPAEPSGISLSQMAL